MFAVSYKLYLLYYLNYNLDLCNTVVFWQVHIANYLVHVLVIKHHTILKDYLKGFDYSQYGISHTCLDLKLQ